jgi:hypothetical protein
VTGGRNGYMAVVRKEVPIWRWAQDAFTTHHATWRLDEAEGRENHSEREKEKT